jgi:uncharacterized protein
MLIDCSAEWLMMKCRVLFFVGLMVLAWSGFAAGPAGEGAGQASNLERVKAGYAAFAAGDMDVVMALLSPELVWHEAETLPYGGVYHGPEAVMENIFMAIGRDWNDYVAEPLRFIDGGVHVVVLGEYRGIHNESGGRLKVPFAHVWRMEAGQLVEFYQFTDTAGWLAAAGLAD